MKRMTWMRLLLMVVVLHVPCSMFHVCAQINISGKVFGGARQANVGGHTFVTIQAEKHDVIINAVYGGNDIAGTIGHSTKPSGVDDGNHISGLAGYNAFVRTDAEATDKHLFIGQLFGGGYGNYTYSGEDGNPNRPKTNGKYDVSLTYTVWDPVAGAYDRQHEATLTDIDKPELAKTYVDLHGGTFGYVYGGGDNVTVTEKVQICINNSSKRTKMSTETNGWDLLTDERLQDMGINYMYYNKLANHNTDISNLGGFLFSRVFGGNNKAAMHIRPSWHLQAGSIENLYSGGNEGPMNSSEGLLMEITAGSQINVYNVYGGCRKADVRPLLPTGGDVDEEDIQLHDDAGHVIYNFPAGLSARVLVRDGDIHNVYGGNDVAGRVTGGNAVGIYHSISGTVYGGGNGSYPYTDNQYLKSSLVYGDFYYDVNNLLGKAANYAYSGLDCAEALNLYRPNAEQVSIRVKGTDAAHPTIISGGIYCGGNSATLKSTKSTPRVELKVGSYVISENVFLGNNGANMIKYENADDVLNLYSRKVKSDGSFKDDSDSEGTVYKKFNTMDLEDPATFAKYMDGCASTLMPAVKFDGDDLTDNQSEAYVDYSTFFGSFFCGGNVGSMIRPGRLEFDFNRPIIVYDKVVGGCNNAFVTAHEGFNAVYEGGIIGSVNERGAYINGTYVDGSYTDGSGHIKNRIELNFNGLKIMPMRMPEAGVDEAAAVNLHTIDATLPEMAIPMVWNTIKNGVRDEEGNYVPVAWNNDTWWTEGDEEYREINSTMNRRFTGGNIYGGCCASGIVNGNVIININSTIVDRHIVFDEVDKDDETGEDKLYGNHYQLKEGGKRTGVILDQQGMDVLGSALNVFGGGKGAETEIWGSATVNLNSGYVFQIFGGSEQGAIGRRKENESGVDLKDAYGRYVYDYDAKYSTYVNLSGKSLYPGKPKSKDTAADKQNMAEAEFLYGGGFAGPIAGDTYVNLNYGRIFNSFAGSCNADIQGHTETRIGADGFPYVRDHVYGGNDLGGKILGQGNFQSRVRDDDDNSNNGNGILTKVHGYQPYVNEEDQGNTNPDVLNAAAYIEYTQGRVENIFGGCYGVYDYTDPLFGDYFYARGGTGTTDGNIGTARDGFSKPYMVSAFVNFRPITNNTDYNGVARIYGAGQGYYTEKEENLLQDRSYILVDVPQAIETFAGTSVFGGGECGGVGMGVDLSGDNPDYDEASAIIDLMRGRINNVYGGSYKEGVTRRSVINVPKGSTIAVNSIFGGAYGIDTYHPCDVYEANVNYWGSANAKVTKAIYGGNNNERRTIYGKVNIYAPVYNGETNAEGTVKYTSTVFGAGCGKNTWSEYTQVNLEDGANIYEVYGGGEAGKVHNAESIQHYMNTGKPNELTADQWKYAWTLGAGYDPETFTFSSNSTSYLNNNKTNLNNSLLVRTAEMDDRTTKTYKYNTNVIIKRGATVSNYAYGGGLGEDAVVAGTTYIALLGGEVKKDIYAAGTSGSVEDLHQAKNFTASANAYIGGGAVRNVYGGGWKGSVGHHSGVINEGQENEYTDYLEAPYYNTATGELIDIPGETHVVIGILKDNLATTIPQEETELDNYYFYNGIPAIERNAYGGGEGGAVWGTTYVVMNNGYIGYDYNSEGTDDIATLNIDERYEEKIVDDTYTDADGHFQENRRLDDAGCIFGGGYIDNSSVDFTNVTMYGGHVRNALFGGGEIAAIGRGKIQETLVEGKAVRTLQGIYRPGKTHVELYDGHVHRNVFGGGRGYNNLGESGHLFSDGYVFGQTEVHIHGGEIGTEKELLAGNGNVFGGGDIGYVYSAYEYDDGNGHKLPRKGVKSGSRYADINVDPYQGYYYEHDWADNGNFILYGTEREFTEDCKVLIEPQCKVIADGGVSFTDIHYPYEIVIPDNDLIYLKENNSGWFTGENPKISANGKVLDADGITFSRSYAKGEYVPIYALNTLGNKDNDQDAVGDGDSSQDKWAKMESNTNDDGIIIHNAVFAGGNTSSKGSDEVSYYANTTSVFGNATASIHDAYHRDLITIGTGHVGGLYGDGNLTKVDGYRGLNITNYGTDYYYFFEEQNKKEMLLSEYEALLEREKAYYELRYKCVKNCTDDDKTNYYKESTEHPNASTLTADDIKTLFKNGTYTSGVLNSDGSINSEYWVQNGVCSIYSGRIMNTIQRADFCGVFGSRMVMQGAQDRVPEVVDYTKYTINRVREVSLNKKLSVITADKNQSTAVTNPKRSRKMHGNYFGIYSVVNYLGALTSDFNFGDQGTDTDVHDAEGKHDNGNNTYTLYTGDAGTGDVRTSDNTNTSAYGPEYDNQTFYGWKRSHKDSRDRNNGNSHNKVALASGVYLELTTEKSIGKGLYEKDWGLITGVIELDLINVQQGMGGGFVYAKNVHGVRKKMNRINTTLTALNSGAVTQWDYTYAEPSLTSDASDLKQREWQTSGNFVHSTQTIIDDCYNVSYRYKGPERVPAHYWYIKGSVYVYDQYISAYTGVTNAYSETVDLPLTITAASHGMMQLLDVQPNKYAYYSNAAHDKLQPDQKLVINNVEYNLNTPISYWEWYKLSAAERDLFVDETYVTTDSCYINNKFYPPGYVMLPGNENATETTSETYWAFKRAADGSVKVVEEGKPAVPAVQRATKDANGNPVVVKDDEDNPVYTAFSAVFHESNNLSHDTGYILSYTVNNPKKWNTWYTPIAGGDKISKEAYDQLSDTTPYEDGPTYHLKNYTDSQTGTLLGQRSYKVSDIIPNNVYTTYQDVVTYHSTYIPHPSEDDPDYEEKKQATFVRAYVATAETDILRGGQTVHVYKGAPLSADEADGASGVYAAFVCTKTIPLSATENIYINSLLTADEKTDYIDGVTEDIQKIIPSITSVRLDNVNTINDLTAAETEGLTAVQKKELSELILRRADMRKCIVEAWYCTDAGKYGGNYYVGGKNYRGLEAWSAMSAADRNQFEFNYDAFDLLIDPTYSQNEKEKYQYDDAEATRTAANDNPAGYSLEQHVDYSATYQGTTGTYTANSHNYTLTNGTTYDRVFYEALPNEQRHYTPLTVTSTDVEGGKTVTFYVAKEPLLVGATPYAAGAVITKAEYDILLAKANNVSSQVPVDVITYSSPTTEYYCREGYTSSTAVTPIGSSTPITDVTVGTRISSTTYEGLTNLQKNFTIHGIAPTETSTLFVSLESDINDLSTEKIITVIYEYNYEESDLSGMHITPICERHVVNIHIEFKTGAPIVEDIEAPQIILPGDYLALTPPNVIEGASPLQGGGWELYKSETDADNHNGIDYTPNTDPLYWYQNGYWLRYYALSHVGGKTYSNKVQVSVANYHDLKKVMEDKLHHYYVDIPDLRRLRDPKIYINDGKDGMNQLKNLYDLSLLTTEPTSEALIGHSLLDPQVRACGNLEFFMRTNVNHTDSWSSIGGGTDPCFEGVFHGDGHYISGLSESLFGKLCGEVYNLGVMGSFTSAGIADTGDGYVENCWVKSSATSGWADDVQAVFGDPNRAEYTAVANGTKLTAGETYYTNSTGGGEFTADGDEVSDGTNYFIKRSIVQLVNSYYPEGNEYKVTENASRGAAKQMPLKSFYNGEVAYDLNGFYLYKRYNDGADTNAGVDYKYFTTEDLAETTPSPSDAYYGTDDTKLSSSGAGVWNKGYVEDRYADGDFRYAGGEIPTEVDVRLYLDKTDHNKPYFYPIWPDDYLFFGQMLTYDWDVSRTHENVPSPIVKTDGRLAADDQNNRVYRAPAYYRSKVMDVAHFNPDVNLVAYSKPKKSDDTDLKAAYPGMTAIDFKGYNDTEYLKGFNGAKDWFYQPLLDDDGLNSIENRDETPNLLVYAPVATAESGYANLKTYTVLNGYFIEPAFNDYYTASGSSVLGDRSVGSAPTQTIVGHLVQDGQTTTNDHLLVDRKDFNCPIDYKMGSGFRMWYQREPANNEYVDLKKGWSAISLPFTAELVTTKKKGEITHFYSGSQTASNTTAKIGHEYWLREYRNISIPTADSEATPADTKAEALFTYPKSTDSWEEKMDKNVTNTFLWDYYYKNANALSDSEHQYEHLDKNLDVYQTYYNSSRTYNDYPQVASDIPYIIGFPGGRYYEFDLSGNFDATTTADDNPDKIGIQTITFASDEEAVIGVSDDERAIVEQNVTTHNGYTFRPNYLNETLTAGNLDGKKVYTLNTEGNSFDIVEPATSADDPVAFRPYFIATNASTRTIVFGNEQLEELKGVDDEHGDPTKEELNGGLRIWTKKDKIFVESSLKFTEDMRVVTPAGITVATFSVKPGQTVEVQADFSGMYIVHTLDGLYTKKVTVKR